MTYTVEITENFLDFAFTSLTFEQQEKIKLKYIIVNEIDKANNKQKRIRELSEQYFCSEWTIAKWYYKNR